MKTLALIGCGEISKMHTANFLKMADIVMPVAFCDLILERAEACVERVGCGKAYTDYKKMLDETNPDMVFIAIPPYCHGEIEMELINRGIPFFVQKPMALDLALARKIRDRIKEKGIITAVGLQSRYSDICTPAQEFVKNNRVISVEGVGTGGIPRTEWWRNKELSGGKVVETSIHQYDLIRYIMGDVDEVFAFSATGFVDVTDFPGYNTDDACHTVLKFKSGAIGYFASGNYSITKDSHPNANILFCTRDKRGELNGNSVGTFDIYGEKPEDYDPTKIKSYKQLNGGLEPSRGTVVHFENNTDYDLTCDRTFVEAVISGDASQIRTSYADVFGSLALVLALRKSLDNGVPVKVENE